MGQQRRPCWLGAIKNWEGDVEQADIDWIVAQALAQQQG
jgi:hypothetical protein